MECYSTLDPLLHYAGHSGCYPLRSLRTHTLLERCVCRYPHRELLVAGGMYSCRDGLHAVVCGGPVDAAAGGRRALPLLEKYRHCFRLECTLRLHTGWPRPGNSTNLPGNPKTWGQHCGGHLAVGCFGCSGWRGPNHSGVRWLYFCWHHLQPVSFIGGTSCPHCGTGNTAVGHA